MERQTFKIGNTTIIVRESNPKEEDIRKCYDVCNELFRGRKECFYTREETKAKNTLLIKERNKQIVM